MVRESRTRTYYWHTCTRCGIALTCDADSEVSADLKLAEEVVMGRAFVAGGGDIGSLPVLCHRCHKVAQSI